MRARAAAIGACATIALLAFAMPVLAVQTFPDPFGGEGIFTDIRAGSKGDDIGDAFFLREGDTLQIEMFLDDADFIETHVCLSARRSPSASRPASASSRDEGAASTSYDITLPPSILPDRHRAIHRSTRILLRPGPRQVHDAARANGGRRWLRVCRLAGGQTVLRQPLLPGRPRSAAAGRGHGGRHEDRRAGRRRRRLHRDGHEPDDRDRPDVVVVEALPARLTPWTVPPECTLNAVDFIATCAHRRPRGRRVRRSRLLGDAGGRCLRQLQQLCVDHGGQPRRAIDGPRDRGCAVPAGSASGSADSDDQGRLLDPGRPLPEPSPTS